MKIKSFLKNSQLLTVTISAILLASCDTLKPDVEPDVIRYDLETIELKDDYVLIDLSESFPEHTYNGVEDKFSDKITTLTDKDGNLETIRYTPGNLFEDPFKIYLTSPRNNPVVATLKLQEGKPLLSSKVKAIGNSKTCRENTLEATIEAGSKLYLDLFDEEDFCEFREKIRHIAIAGKAHWDEPIEGDTPGGGSKVGIYLRKENPENNLLYFEWQKAGVEEGFYNLPHTDVGVFSVVINYADSLDIRNDAHSELIWNDPRYSDVLVHRKIKITMVPKGSLHND